MNPEFPIQVRTITGLEEVLADELRALGAKDVKAGKRVVYCTGDKAILYKANISCRCAIRVLRPLKTFAAPNEEALYNGVREIDWTPWLNLGGTVAVDANVYSSFTTHSLYLAQKAKDAVVDQFREQFGKRPSVDLENPDLRIAVTLFQNEATVFVDSSGESLHKRGYRRKSGEAPMSEVLAAGIIKLSGWDGSTPLIDPMTGSGTLAIEAGLIAANIAPGLFRKSYGFEKWKDFNGMLLKKLIQEARAAIKKEVPCEIFAFDHDSRMVEIAKENISNASLAKIIRLEVADFFTWDKIPAQPGVLGMNPPYDERLPVDNVAELYQKIGNRFREKYAGWKNFVLAGNLEAIRYVGLKSSRRTELFNGPIECRLLEYEIYDGSQQAFERKPKPVEIDPKWKEKGDVLANRLKKNYKHLSRWAKRENVNSWRVYHWDIPELAFYIDIYGDRLHFAEVERNHEHTPIEHSRYMKYMVDTAAEALGISPDKVYFKKRKPQSVGGFQYAQHDETGDFFEVEEHGHKFLVNLADYLDVGLFLDHRSTRAMVEKEAKGKDFLNLFAYTGSFSVYAAAGAAKSTTTVDTSKTYLEWAQKNLKINGYAGFRYKFERSDAMEFLDYTRAQYDLAVVDPPTRSVNRSSGRNFDVQQDHVQLLKKVFSRMRPKGKVYFSTNYRTFKLDEVSLKQGRNLNIREITAQTTPPDFSRKPSHRCWMIELQ